MMDTMARTMPPEICRKLDGVALAIELATASRNRQGMSRELISEPGSAAVCGIRSHNGFTIYYPGFKFSVHTGHAAQR
jgi:hypothetical protein